MKFLWVNNVSKVCGGTLQATHSMVRALPDAEHMVFSFGAPFSEEAERIFEGVCLRCGLSVQEVVNEWQPDVIVYQNTIPERMPRNVPDHCVQVYYQHSIRKAHRASWKQCDLVLSVSHYLCDQMGMDHDTVLYQPVTIPNSSKTRIYGSIDCVRIATPSPKKWRDDEWLPHVDAICDAFPDVKVHTVGHPDVRHRDSWERGEALAPSFAGRSLLRRSNILLYTSMTVETFGRTVREAQRCGCVPIVSRSGGFIEQIENKDGKDYGFLIETPEDAVRAVEDYLRDPDGWSRRVEQRGHAEGSLEVWRGRFLERLKEV